MKITVKNLGAIKQADFILGDLTIICGGNNTGKTYVTYALFGFLLTWRRSLSLNVSDKIIDQLLSDGVIRLELQDYIKQAVEIISKGCQVYTKQLSSIFAAPSDRFKETEFKVDLDVQMIRLDNRFDSEIGSNKITLFSITKDEKSTELVISLLVNKGQAKIPSEVLKHVIADSLKEIIFAQLFPRPFIASAERTGAAIFRKELNFARNRLLEEMGQADKDVDPRELLLKEYDDYALPIKMNVEFNRKLESLIRRKSFITENHPEILFDFADIIGGEYMVARNDELYYIPKGKRVKLSMDESSSAVRSLLDIGFYLRHESKQGDLLMVDEPELNLHPENQRRITRLFARLVNVGIKVFITTHSDYMIKELNTLIMLNNDRPHLKRIVEDEGYRPEELISSERVKVYIAEEASIMLDGKNRKTRCQTLVAANIDSDLGIEAPSFDITIETMNRIQEAIVWGKD